MNKVRIIFFGTPHFVIPTLSALEENYQLVGVVTAPDRKVGRHQTLTPSPVKVAYRPPAQLITPQVMDDDFIEQLKKLNPDLLVVEAYGKIIPKAVLDIPKYGALNIHPSLLPKYRGASPIQAAILHGDQESGVTIIKMDEKMDHGPIIYTNEIKLSEQDTFETLSNKMFLTAVNPLIKIIPKYTSGKIKLKEQDHRKATFCKIVEKEDGYFDIENPPSPIQLDRMIRAYYPWPTAWTRWSYPAKASRDKKEKIIKFLPGGLIQMEGKKPLLSKNFLNGYPNFPLNCNTFDKK